MELLFVAVDHHHGFPELKWNQYTLLIKGRIVRGKYRAGKNAALEPMGAGVVEDVVLEALPEGFPLIERRVLRRGVGIVEGIAVGLRSFLTPIGILATHHVAAIDQGVLESLLAVLYRSRNTLIEK